ncbi:hypothetical protein BpHYR1_038285 [Brachionus plicatilis]|uniref:Uncharacterized protein n=1 Tax=Brachionus plicatilis TaxID=10195 RepID=A0A3M7PUG8_BRAPC|nr:hypothetical protein BpHYR1_038285 [Brachionus plicatilis]
MVLFLMKINRISLSQKNKRFLSDFVTPFGIIDSKWYQIYQEYQQKILKFKFEISFNPKAIS